MPVGNDTIKISRFMHSELFLCVLRDHVHYSHPLTVFHVIIKQFGTFILLYVLYVFHPLQTFHTFIRNLLNVCGFWCEFYGFFFLETALMQLQREKNTNGKKNK